MVNLVSYYKSSSHLNRSCGVFGRHNDSQKADESAIAETSMLRVAYFMQHEVNLCGPQSEMGLSMGNSIKSPNPVMEREYCRLLYLICKALEGSKEIQLTPTLCSYLVAIWTFVGKI